MGNQQIKDGRYNGRKIDWAHAERPSPPGKPYLSGDNPDQQLDVITIRWALPESDGGAPIIGYLVEHRRTGSPHWLRASPLLAEENEFTLTGLEPGWRYQFRVSAENGIGKSEPSELSEPLTVTLLRSAASAPHFNRELHDTIALENEKVEFIVHVIATPAPKISWYKDGFEVFSSRRMKIMTQDEQSSLIIHQAALEDEGEIKCTATNRAGHVVTKAYLKLEAPPRIRLPRQYEEGLLFEKGEMIRLKVSTVGRPLPSVHWYHNGELLDNSARYEVTDSDRSSSVKISEACREDRGEYLIKGINKIGEDVVSFLVTVTDRPSPPGRVQVIMTLGRSITLTWTTPEDDGGCKIGNYIVEYFRVGWNMWLKAMTCRQLTITLNELIEGSEYKFRVKAENPYGVSDPGEESETIFIPDPKRGIVTPPPRIETEEMDTWLDEAKKRPATEEKDLSQEAKRRKLLEENAKKLLDTPLPILLSQENTRLKVIEKPPRKNRTSATPSPQMVRSSAEPEEDNYSPPLPPKRRHRSDRLPSEEMQLDEGVDEKPQEQRPREAVNFLTTTELREKDDRALHGSSELMLVLLPQDRAKSLELSERQRSEIQMTLNEAGVAPPMSLSAPELGTGEILEIPPMRDAVSSTEILHERAMARFYQAAADEEAQKLLMRRFSTDRKSIERRASFKESLLERRHSARESGQVPEKEMDRSGSEDRVEKSNYQTDSKLVTKVKESVPLKIAIESKIPIAINRGHAATEATDTKAKALVRTRQERLSSVEREQAEFALVRDRIREKNEQFANLSVFPSRPPKLKQQSELSGQMSSFEGEDDSQALEEEEEEEEEEEIEELIDEEELEEEQEDGYLEEEEEEMYEDEPVESSLNDAKFRPKLGQEVVPPVPKHGIPNKPLPEEPIEPKVLKKTSVIQDKTSPMLKEKAKRDVVTKLEEEVASTSAGSGSKENVTEEEFDSLDLLVERHDLLKTRSPPRSQRRHRDRGRKAPQAEEEETYHPRSMLPTRSVIPKFECALPVTLEATEDTKTEEDKTTTNVLTKVDKASTNVLTEVDKTSTNVLTEESSSLIKDEVPSSKPQDEKPEKSEREEAKKPEPSKIPVPAPPVEKKKNIFKTLEKLTLKRDKKNKKSPTFTKMVIDTTVPMASLTLPKPILKKKSSKKKEVEESTDTVDRNGDEGDNRGEPEDEETNRKKKQVRIAEPGEGTSDGKSRLRRRQESLEEDEEANRVLICHYSDIVKEYGGVKKATPKMYLNLEELEAHASPEDEQEDPFKILHDQQERIEQEETCSVNSATEERGSVLGDMDNEEVAEENDELEETQSRQDVDEPKVEERETCEEMETDKDEVEAQVAEQPAEASRRTSSERTHSPSPTSQLRPRTPEERVRGSIEYLTDVAMFVVACWLYLFKNELYAIPVLCLMVYRQVKDSIQEKYQAIKESIASKIPKQFISKQKEEEEECVGDDDKD